MTEFWKDVKGYEGKYKVSNTGKVLSLNFNKTGKPCLLKPTLTRLGYHTVGLSGKTVFVHRITAEAFIPNPENKPHIDHINTITTDNRIDNLRWVTPAENLLNPISNERRIKRIKDVCSGKFGADSHRHRKVRQYSKDGEFLKEWECMSDAWRFYNLDSGAITKCCQGKRHIAGGFKWRYADDI